jgi:ribosomal protein L7Ae-like RNA K-turn-binding protein
MTSSALQLFSLCRKGGFAALGEDAVSAEARAGHAKLIIVAQDAADHTWRRAQNLARTAACPVSRVDATKQELGYSVGRSTCALAAVTDAGLALNFGKATGCLTEEQLSVLQAFDARQRQLRKEAKAHAKNVRNRKRN